MASLSCSHFHYFSSRYLIFCSPCLSSVPPPLHSIPPSVLVRCYGSCLHSLPHLAAAIPALTTFAPQQSLAQPPIHGSNHSYLGVFMLCCSIYLPTHWPACKLPRTCDFLPVSPLPLPVGSQQDVAKWRSLLNAS